MQRRLDLHHRGVARRDAEAVGPGEARGVEQRPDLDGAGIGLGLADPEGGEVGEFLRARPPGADGGAPGREPVFLAESAQPEVGGAEEDQEFLLIRRPVGRSAAKA
jgi:hypothetical protein